MKKEDYFGKYFLRHGDLKPEEINEQSWKHYGLTVKFLAYLDEQRLLLDKGESRVLLHLIDVWKRQKELFCHPLVTRLKKQESVYISGPISGHDLEERRKTFEAVEESLAAKGYMVVNPMKNGLPANATTYEHMRRDIELLMNCDYIYMMKKWRHSMGCQTEFAVATAIHLPVMFEEGDDVIKFE